jgi:hypothetical protein
MMQAMDLLILGQGVWGGDQYVFLSCSSQGRSAEECGKIAGRTLLQLLLMSGISEVELMVRRNYTDPFIVGIARRSEECLKKFFVMPPSLITKIFTTYPAKHL